MPVIPEYRPGGTVTIPGPGSIPTPRATPDTFGAMGGRSMVKVGEEVSNFAIDYMDKKAKENADIFVGKTAAAARRQWTENYIERKKTANADIANDLDIYMGNSSAVFLAQAPNADARVRAGIALDTLRSTLGAKAIISDDAARIERLKTTLLVSHDDRKAAVFQDFSQLNTAIEASNRQIIALNIPDNEKVELSRKYTYELGFDAIQGLIDMSETGAKDALKMLNDPKDPIQFYLDKTNKQKLIKYAETTIKSHEADRRVKFNMAEKLRAQAQRTEKNRLMKLHENGTLTNEIIKNSTLDATGKEWVRDMIRKDAAGDPAPPAEDRAAVFADLMDSSDYLDPEDQYWFEDVVLQYRSDRFINDQQMNLLLKKVSKPTNQARKRVETMFKNTLTRSNALMGFKDPKGDALYNKAMIELDELVDQQEEAGEPVYNLFNPQHDDYKKVHAILERIRRTPLEISQDFNEANMPRPKTPEAPTTPKKQSSSDPSPDDESTAIGNMILEALTKNKDKDKEYEQGTDIPLPPRQ